MNNRVPRRPDIARVPNRALAAWLALALCVLSACASSPARGAGKTGTHVSPTATTPPPTATPTLVRVAPLSGATLGGTRDGFNARYGPPFTPDLWDNSGVTFSLVLSDGTDGQPHVASILIYKTDAATWSLAQAKQVCGAFLPPDATYQRDTTAASGYQEGVYRSAGVASTFPASAFGAAPLGSFSLVYEAPSTTSAVFQCVLAIGIQ